MTLSIEYIECEHCGYRMPLLIDPNLNSGQWSKKLRHYAYSTIHGLEMREKKEEDNG